MRLPQKATRIGMGIGVLASVTFLSTVSRAAEPPDAETVGAAIEALQTRPVLAPMGTGSLAAITASRVGKEADILTNGPEFPGPKRPNALPDPRTTPDLAPDPADTPVSGPGGKVFGFDALNHADSRFANNGNQFSGEPPDQALCVGSGYTFEIVNQVLNVYDGTGAQLQTDATINEFFGLPPTIRRTNPPTFGPFAFDPVCLYDAQLERWFVVVTELDQDPFTGAFTGGSHLYIAVSHSADPTRNFSYFGITTTAGDSTDSGCPCFDDFPHIGADVNGFFISVNRFSVNGPEFNGAQIYAISKQGLADAASEAAPSPVVVSLNAGRVNGNPSFTVQPATVPPGGVFPRREYFLSTLDFDTNSESDIAVWALSNTKSLDRNNPKVSLTRSVIPSLTYAFEPDAEQREGPHPLGEAVGEPLNRLDSASDMTEVTFASRRLWATTSTAVGARGEDKRVGTLWFQVNPTFSDGQVGGTVVKQGYVAVAENNLLYPSVGVNASGEGAIVMSLAGPTVYPSTSFISIDKKGVGNNVRVTKYGAAPDDGFTCYEAYVGSRDRGCRWGDYSEAVADENGDIWMATAYIPDTERTELANWGTFVMRLDR